ncbi:hypothetical protein ACFW6F_14045 [Streptomyces sp. NPDC058746]|uniref:hypothetical protein n=1 Tax=Streptomyces sp. NPDC058746 TaxID=3346622 RepID=UPI003677D9A4
MEWATVVTVLIGGLIGLSGDAIGRIGSRRQAKIARQENLEDAEIARSQAIEDGNRKERGAREMRAVESILSAYLENPIMLLNQPREETVLSITKIYMVLGFEQSFILDGELRQRVTEICYFLDLAAGGDVGEYSPAEVGFLARNETWMLMGAWARGEDLPDSIEGWGEIRRSRAEIEAHWQQKLRDAGLRVTIPPISTY